MAEPTSPHAARLLARLETVAAQLEEKYQNDEWMQKEIAKARGRVPKYIAAYEEGRPFFSRALLADLDRQIDAAQESTADDGVNLKIVDVVGKEFNESFKPPEWLGPDCNIHSIIYDVSQKITQMSLSVPDNLINRETPVRIMYTSATTPSGWSLEELQAAFRLHQASWLKSAPCQSVSAFLASATFPTPVTKIVCFGLGRLDAWEKTTTAELNESLRRSATQHAAALTMAKALGRRRDADGDILPVFSQDPVYADREKELLAALGITVLEDPKGFLAIDDGTLVFSVTPNVPVKQIVADVKWPPVMVWNTVKVEEEDEYDKDYTWEDGERGEFLCSPWTTDNDSSRTRDMVKSYSHFPFPRDTDDDRFGDLSIYIKL